MPDEQPRLELEVSIHGQILHNGELLENVRLISYEINAGRYRRMVIEVMNWEAINDE